MSSLPLVVRNSPIGPIHMTTATYELNEDMIIEAEHLRNDTANLLNSLSIPGPLIGQLVAESMLGFLFILDGQGFVEFVSDTSNEYIGYSPKHIEGYLISKFLHPKDHSPFGSLNLLKMMHQQFLTTEHTDLKQVRRNVTCRFRLKGGVHCDQTDFSQYVRLYVSCFAVRRNPESADTSRLLCLARRYNDVWDTINQQEQPVNMPVLFNLLTTKWHREKVKNSHASVLNTYCKD